MASLLNQLMAAAALTADQAPGLTAAAAAGDQDGAIVLRIMADISPPFAIFWV